MYLRFPLVVFLLLSFVVDAQYNFSSNTAHLSIIQSINVSNDVIKARTLEFEKKAENKPLMFLDLKQKMSELNKASNSVSDYIETVQKEVESERVLYELIEDDFYENLMFTADGALSDKGLILKVKVDSLFQLTKKINIHNLTHLDEFANIHFNTKEEYYDAQENKVDYFEHLFYDKTNYGIMMMMNYLMLDVKTFQLLYFGTIMSY